MVDPADSKRDKKPETQTSSKPLVAASDTPLHVRPLVLTRTTSISSEDTTTTTTMTNTMR